LANTHALFSIGAVAVEASFDCIRTISEFEVWIAPHPDTSVSSGSFKANGETWATIGAEWREDESIALQQFFEWLEPYRSLPIFAHNAPFDRDFLSAAIRRSASGHDWAKEITGRHANWICTIGLANLLIATGKMARPNSGLSLDSLCEFLRLPGRQSLTNGHDALEDAQVGAVLAVNLLKLGRML
jgi:DNA polymerase III epsilon subunit-like protein